MATSCAPTSTGNWDDATVSAVIDAVAGSLSTSRPYGSESSRQAARDIESALVVMGLSVERRPVRAMQVAAIGVGSYQVVPARYVRGRDGTDYLDDNLIVRIPGFDHPDKGATLVMAHYDSVEGAPGAVDNGVAVAVLIELARRLSARPPAQPVVIAFTAAEEPGLVGARALAKELGGQVAVAVALDLVGGGGTLALNGLGPKLGYRWLRHLQSVAIASGVRVVSPPVHRYLSRKLPTLERSDHGPFTVAGVPALHLYHRGPDGNVYLPYHTELDELSRVRRDSVGDTGTFVEALVRSLAEPPSTGGDTGVWLNLAIHTFVVPAAVVWIASILALALALGLVWTGRRRRPRAAGAAVFRSLVLWIVSGGALFACFYLWSGLGRHPLPWAHVAGTATAVGMAAFMGTFIAVRAATGWHTENATYVVSVIATAYFSVIVAVALAVDAVELVGPFAVAALGSAVSHCRWRWRFLGLLAAALPACLALEPALLREAVFHGFYPVVVPLPAYVLLFAGPPLLLVLVNLPRLPRHLAMLAGAGFVATALVIVSTNVPPCSAEDFARYRLACEIKPGAAALRQPSPQ